MVDGTIIEGHQPQVLDVAKVVKSAWDSVAPRTVARYA